MNENYKKLKEYFSNLKNEDVLSEFEKHPFIDMNWIFTEVIDRDIIQKAISNIMQQNNPRYAEKSSLLGMKPDDIQGFEIVRNQGKLIFVAIGADSWTKLNITDEKIDDSNVKESNRIKTITFEDLRNEIMNVLNNRNLDEANNKLILAGMSVAFEQACGNLVDYYQYLLQENKEQSIHKCVINQRKDYGETRVNRGGVTHPRLNDIIDFKRRSDFLHTMNPEATVEVGEIDEDGKEASNAYTAFIYSGELLADIEINDNGYLIVCEPFNGNRGSRLVYLSNEDFEEFPIERGQDKYAIIVKKYLDMSGKEFRKHKSTHSIAHTDLDSYKERVQFFMKGTKGRSITNIKQYKASLEKLYGENGINLPYYTPRTIIDIGRIGESVPISRVDRTAQRVLARQMEDKNIVQETN